MDLIRVEQLDLSALNVVNPTPNLRTPSGINLRLRRCQRLIGVKALNATLQHLCAITPIQ